MVGYTGIVDDVKFHKNDMEPLGPGFQIKTNHAIKTWFVRSPKSGSVFGP